MEPWASPQPVIDCLRLLFTKGTHWVCGEAEQIGVSFQGQSVTGWKAPKEDRVRTVTIGHAIYRPGEPALKNWLRRVTGGCRGCFGFGVCELVARDSFVPWYPQEGCRAWSTVEE